MTRQRTIGGFTLIELLVVIAIIALLIGILLPALGEARRTARAQISGSNLRQLATGMNSYATDFKDRITGFNWRKGDKLSQYSDLNNGGDDIAAAANQAVDIIRRRTGRDNFPKIGGWIPHILYSHLTMMDYLASRLPEKIMACPEDRHRTNWQKDPENNFDKGVWLPFQAPIAPNTNWRWPYSCSYRPTISSFDTSPEGRRINQEGVIHNLYQTGGPGGLCMVTGTRLSSVQAPAQKVFYFEGFQWHTGKKQSFYAWPLAKIAMVAFDGSVTVRNNAGEANRGWKPNSIKNAAGTAFMYNPTGAAAPWDPPPSNNDGKPSDDIIGYVQYTRGGLAGIDFGGTEMDTGQPFP